jgi:hypothetical protein
MIELLIAILLGLVSPIGNTNESKSATKQTSSENVIQDTGGGDKQIPPQIF